MKANLNKYLKNINTSIKKDLLFQVSINSSFHSLNGRNKSQNSNKTFNQITFKNYFAYPCPRKLREICKMSLIEKETPETVKEIWKTYHTEKNRVFSDVVNGELMNTITKK